MSDEAFVKHTPVFPLPAEIQQMKRDETVCKYCGVSYLIHNEIKALEDKLKATERELQHYKHCEESEKSMRIEMEKVLKKMDESKQQLDNKEQENEKLTEDIEKKSDEIKNLTSIRDCLQESLQRNKSKVKLLHESLPEVILHLSDQRKQLKSIDTQVKQTQSELNDACKRITNTVNEICQKEITDFQTLQAKIGELESELNLRTSKIEKYEKELLYKDEEIDRLQPYENNMSELQENYASLQKSNKELTNKFEKLLTESRAMKIELDQYKDQLRSKNQVIEDLHTQSKNKDVSSDINIGRLREQLQEKEREMEGISEECQTLKHKYQVQQRLEEESQRKASASLNETEELRISLARTRGDMEALRSEREMLIGAHQNRIEELRQSFKRKMAEAERWPEKVEEAMKQERERHSIAMTSLENKLKENFIMELQIEKQKYQELMEKYQVKHKESEAELRSQLNAAQSKHRSEITDLHKQIAMSKASARETEDSLRKETTSLKTSIRDLETRLGKLDLSDSGSVATLKSQLLQCEQKLYNVTEERTQLAQQLENSRTEIVFLQDTVRRECEERFELTEALSEAKEQLLALHKGTHPQRISSAKPPQKTASPTPRTQSVGPRSEEMLLYKRRASNPTVGSSVSSSVSKDSNSSNINVGYEGESAKTPGKLKGSTMADSRKRIAAAVGRR